MGLGQYSIFVSGAIKGKRKCGRFKISLSHLRSGKILTSITSGESEWVGEKGKGCVECGGMVRLSARNS